MHFTVIRACAPQNDSWLFAGSSSELSMPADSAILGGALQSDPCADDTGRRGVAIKHELPSVAEHDKYIAAYEAINGAPAPTVSHSWADVQGIINTYAYLVFKLVNGVLKMTGSNSPVEPGFTDYSRCHVLGMRLLHTEDDYYFTMAYRDTAPAGFKTTVVINIGNSGYYDFSNLYP